MILKLLPEHHLGVLSLKGGGTGSSESTLVKMSNCWKSHAVAPISTSYSKNLAALRRLNIIRLIRVMPLIDIDVIWLLSLVYLRNRSSPAVNC